MYSGACWALGRKGARFLVKGINSIRIYFVKDSMMALDL